MGGASVPPYPFSDKENTMAFQPVELDMHDITITPVFRHESIEDVNASEREGVLQKKIQTVVEVRFAGTDRYQPVFPVDAHWQAAL
jgi:hypothetical protein